MGCQNEFQINPQWWGNIPLSGWIVFAGARIVRLKQVAIWQGFISLKLLTVRVSLSFVDRKRLFGTLHELFSIFHLVCLLFLVFVLRVLAVLFGVYPFQCSIFLGFHFRSYHFPGFHSNCWSFPWLHSLSFMSLLLQIQNCLQLRNWLQVLRRLLLFQKKHVLNGCLCLE